MNYQKKRKIHFESEGLIIINENNKFNLYEKKENQYNNMIKDIFFYILDFLALNDCILNEIY